MRAHTRQFFLTPSYFCDEDCVFCGVPKSVRDAAAELDRETLLGTVDRMGLTENDILTLSGGEPLHSPSFHAVIEYATSTYGCKVWVLTNGRRLRDRKFAESIAPLGIHKLVVALFSHEEGTHDAITQRRRSFQHTWQGLQNLAELDIPFQGKFIALRENHTHALPTYRLFRSRFPKQVFTFSGLTYFGETVTNIDRVGARFADVAPSLDELLAAADEAGDLVPVFMFPLCHVDPVFWRHYNVAAFEEVVVAPGHEDTADGRTLAEGPKPPACRSCRARSRCVFGWKPAYHDHFGDAEFLPVQ